MSKSTFALDVTTPGDTEVVFTRSFAAPRKAVFEAFTNPALISRWLLGPDGWSMPTCEVDLRPGGRFRYRWRSDTDGREFGVHGEYREIERPERILRTEAFDGMEAMPDAMVTEAFEERDGTTTMTMTITYPSRAIRDRALESGMAGGVATSFDRLERQLAE